MGRINVLDKTVSELIAAGEVIERPASIVKELLENAIDAQSTAITIEIKNGGITYISIKDNGIGFEKDDMPVAFLRHATSKVATMDDLDNIGTLGFRGEALASIGAVSKVELFSKTENDEYGTRIFIQGSENTGVEVMGCPKGTTIIVRDLFYNVPARLKFLKKESYEASQIQNIVEKIALSHPNISFKFIKDNKVIIHTPGDGKLFSAIYSVMGKEVTNSFIPVKYDYNGITIEGYTSKTSVGRNNRKMQHFFVNDRYVKSVVCLAAVEESYKNRLITHKFPACVLKIYIDFSKVDVNVHPAKIEIRFTDESQVYKALYFAISSAIENNDELKVQQVSDKNPYVVNQFQNTSASQTKIVVQDNQKLKPRKAMLPLKENSFETMSMKEFQDVLKKDEYKPEKYTSEEQALLKKSEEQQQNKTKKIEIKKDDIKTNNSVKKKQDTSDDEKYEEEYIPKQDNMSNFDFINKSSFDKKQENIVTEPVSVVTIIEDDEVIKPKVIGEIFKTYVLFELEDKFILLDKHAAHERIIFERLKTEISLKQKQMLLTTIKVELTPKEKAVFVDKKDIFFKFGFNFSEKSFDESLGVVLIKEVPMVMSEQDCAEIFMEILKNIISLKEDLSPQAYEEMLHSMACKSAIKANNKHSIEELTELVEQVYANNKIRHCPHGRPVIIVMTKNELDKKFGRIM